MTMFGTSNQPQYNNGYQPQYGGMRQAAPQAPAKLESLDDLLSGSGAKSFFSGDSQPGASITGTLELIETTQVRDFKTKQPTFWDDGRPQMQIHIVIQTTLRDPSVDDDDGRRSVWVKGWGIQLKAFREACRQAGVKKPAQGDRFTATFTGLGERGNNPQAPKLYEYHIEHSDGVDQLLGQQQQQVPAYQQPVQPQPQPMGQYQQVKPQPVQQAPAGPAYQQPQVGYSQPPQQQVAQQQVQQPVQQVQQPVQPQVQAVNPQQILQLKSLGKSPQEIAGLLNITPQQVFAVTDAASPSMHQGSEDQPEF